MAVKCHARRPSLKSLERTDAYPENQGTKIQKIRHRKGSKNRSAVVRPRRSAVAGAPAAA